VDFLNTCRFQTVAEGPVKLNNNNDLAAPAPTGAAGAPFALFKASRQAAKQGE